MDLCSVFINKILFPAMERFKGNHIRQYVNELAESENLSYSELNTLHVDKLRELLLHAIDNVPAYKQYKKYRQDIIDDPVSAIENFTPLTKAEFRKNPLSYIASGINPNSLISNATGGSTGQPTKFYIDRKCVEYYEAARYRGLSWHDIKIGDRCVMIWGAPIELNRTGLVKYKLKERLLKNRFAIPAYDLNPDSVKSIVGKINRFKPVYLYGYASSMYLLAMLMLERGVKFNFQLTAAVSTSEVLHDYQREAMENAFNCPVINEYGAKDGGIIAYECPNGGMHISSENLHLEVLDMITLKPVRTGESGLIAVTDLNNFSAPRIRYIVGDTVSVSRDACLCGRSLPILSKIDGREDDTFITTDGVLVHGHFVNHIARNLKGIDQFRCIQHTRRDIELIIVKGPDFDMKEIEFFVSEIKKKMGDVEVTLNYTSTIPPLSSGKIRYAIREFSLEGGEK